MRYGQLLVGAVLGAGLATTATVYAMKADELNANNFVLRTTMAGSPSVLSIATSADGLTVYSATAGGFFKSTDGGQTWQKLPVK